MEEDKQEIIEQIFILSELLNKFENKYSDVLTNCTIGSSLMLLQNQILYNIENEI
jgi:hypothetical protein